jgi:hypothetical protein
MLCQTLSGRYFYASAYIVLLLHVQGAGVLHAIVRILNNHSRLIHLLTNRLPYGRSPKTCCRPTPREQPSGPEFTSAKGAPIRALLLFLFKGKLLMQQR